MTDGNLVRSVIHLIHSQLGLNLARGGVGNGVPKSRPGCVAETRNVSREPDGGFSDSCLNNHQLAERLRSIK